MNGSESVALPSSGPQIVLSPNNHVEGLYNAQQASQRTYNHQHNRGSSISSRHIPSPAFPQRPDTPESQEPGVDPQVYASLQQQYLELLATNQYLYQLQQQQQYNAGQYNQMAFLSPPRTPVSSFSPQFAHESMTGYLSPNPERHQFQSPRRQRFDESSEYVDYPVRVPTPAKSPSPVSSDSSRVTRGHRRGKSSISIGGNMLKLLPPIRQPIGPPPMEALLAKRVSGEQSPNFSSRLRQKAVNRLMQAGMERKLGGVPQFEVRDERGQVPATTEGEETGLSRQRTVRRSALF
jgi:hypothetical protein